MSKDNENSITDNGTVFSDEQLRIADLLLKLLSEKNGQLDMDQQTYFHNLYNFNWQQFDELRRLLIDEDLIEIPDDNKYYIRLLSDGRKALKNGLKRFLLQRDQNNKPLTIQGGNVNLGTNYGGQNINHSSLENSLVKPTTQITNKAIAHKPSASLLNKIYWVVGIIISIIAIYKFFIEHGK
jgi:hypothetical protein